MIELNAPLMAVIITVLLAMLGLAYSSGALANKVKGNRLDINQLEKDFKEYLRENKQDHEKMQDKLDKVLQNGHH